jgi:hypothetical protein
MMSNALLHKEKTGRPKKMDTSMDLNFLSQLGKSNLADRALACAKANMDPTAAYRVNGSKQLKDCHTPQETFQRLIANKQVYFYGVPQPGDLVFFNHNALIVKIKMVDYFDPDLKQLFVVGVNGPEKVNHWYSFGKVIE